MDDSVVPLQTVVSSDAVHPGTREFWFYFPDSSDPSIQNSAADPGLDHGDSRLGEVAHACVLLSSHVLQVFSGGPEAFPGQIQS